MSGLNQMGSILTRALSSSQYIPHGHCYLWQTPLVTLHIVSNALIAIAYFSIPALLLYFVKKRQDVPFSSIFALFGAFIVLCGAGHLLDIWTLWHPDYWLSGLEHAVTAFVSCVTALQMVTLLPQFLALKTPEQLEAINRELQQEILERQKTEAERNRAYEEMEFRVQERTADLEHANTALRQSEARFQRFAANVPGMLYQYKQDSDGTAALIYVSDAYRKIYEMEPETVNDGYFEAIYSDDRQQRKELLAQSTKDLQSFEHEWRIIVPSGAMKWIQAISKPQREPDGSTVWDGIQMDVSERKRIEAERDRMEAALRHSEARFQKLAENLPGMIYQFRLNAVGEVTFPYINAFCREFYEVEPEAVQHDASLILDRVHPDDRDSFLASIAASHETLQPWDWMGRFIMPSGQVKWLHGISRPERQTDGSTVWDGLQLDISDRKQAEVALQEALQETEYQSRLLRTVLDSTQDWIFAKDRDFRYILVNRSFANAVNQSVEAMLGKNDLELGFSKELVFGNLAAGIRGFRSADEAVLAGEAVHNPYDLATLADGSTRIFDTSKTPLYDANATVFALLGSSRDITDRYNAEKALRRSKAELKEKAEELEQTLRTLRLTQVQMIQAEKMSGLGQLVAGIAHEINNPVNFIYGNLTPARDYAQDLLHLLTLYQMQMPHPSLETQAFIEEIDLEFVKEDLPKLLDSMKTGTQRIKEIVLSLRNFSRLDETGSKAVDLHEGIENTLVVLGNRLKVTAARPEIQIIKQYGELPLVECHAGQLNQVFMNILNNAIDALEEPPCFTNTLLETSSQPSFDFEVQKPSRSSRLTSLSPSITIRTELVKPHHIQICIADNGLGMLAEVQQKLFDPFFTTKPVGKGTGMGLAICYQVIVDQHQGTIEVRSALGQGTEINITLPY